jgi:1-acyl-sn-glycerol-3-phosphate acyltransferase
MGSFSHFVKTLIYHNPLDAFVYWHRKHLAKKGPDNAYHFDQQVFWRFAYVLFPKILGLTNRFTFEGHENLKDVDGPFMVTCNHNDSLDSFFASVAISCGTRNQRMHVSWVSTLANMQAPLVKSIISYSSTIPLGPDRKVDEHATRLIAAAIHRGQGIGFFPEGSLGKNKADRSSIQALHAGAARLCLEHRIPYIPMVLHGRRSFFKGKARACIGHPVYLDPALECTAENARLVSIDMRVQMQAMFDGKPDIPRSRFEMTPHAMKEQLRHAYAPLQPTAHAASRRPAIVAGPIMAGIRGENSTPGISSSDGISPRGMGALDGDVDIIPSRIDAKP